MVPNGFPMVQTSRRPVGMAGRRHRLAHRPLERGLRTLEVASSPCRPGLGLTSNRRHRPDGRARGQRAVASDGRCLEGPPPRGEGGVDLQALRRRCGGCLWACGRSPHLGRRLPQGGGRAGCGGVCLSGTCPGPRCGQGGCACSGGDRPPLGHSLCAPPGGCGAAARRHLPTRPFKDSTCCTAWTCLRGCVSPKPAIGAGCWR